MGRITAAIVKVKVIFPALLSVDPDERLKLVGLVPGHYDVKYRFQVA
jgi:hypothetical protein